MPVRWTPETDQILLLKILETSNVSVNAKAVVEAWPSDKETPTMRAITERLVKIRTNAQKNGSSANFTVSNARSGANASTPSSTPCKARSTPVKNGRVTKNVNGKCGAGNKRKQRVEPPTDDSEFENDSLKSEASLTAAGSTTDYKSPSKNPKVKTEDVDDEYDVEVV